MHAKVCLYFLDDGSGVASYWNVGKETGKCGSRVEERMKQVFLSVVLDCCWCDSDSRFTESDNTLRPQQREGK